MSPSEQAELPRTRMSATREEVPRQRVGRPGLAPVAPHLE